MFRVDIGMIDLPLLWGNWEKLFKQVALEMSLEEWIIIITLIICNA